MNSFVFDLDDTLTDARQVIDNDFKNFMHEFAGNNSCYICTGSDYGKIVEQIGTDLCNQFETIFACSGNHHLKQGKEIYKSKWQLTSDQQGFLIKELSNNTHFKYNPSTGNHLELRTGSANLSIPGRNATQKQRDEFEIWEKANKSREPIAERFNKLFPDCEAIVAGVTGIDIFEKGKSKAQVKALLSNIIFFGDRCYPGGNDYPLSSIVDTHFQIDNGWKQTFEILKDQYHNH